MPVKTAKSPPAKSVAPKKRGRSREYYTNHMPSGLVGRTIVAIRPMTREEVEQEGWPYYANMVPTAIALDSGDIVFAVTDRGGGTITPALLLGNAADGRPFAVPPTMEAGTKIEKQQAMSESVRKTPPHVVELGATKRP